MHSFRGESRFTTWAHKSAVRAAFRTLRRQHWQDVSLQDLLAEYDEGDLTPALLSDPAPTPEQQVTRQMLLETVWRLINEELTDRQRRAMIGVMIGKMPLEEVARRMGINRNTLYKVLHDARQRLKKRMMPRGYPHRRYWPPLNRRQGQGMSTPLHLGG